MTGTVGESLVDIVDEQDRMIDTVPRSQMRAQNLRHRGVGIAVVDGRDRLLVHRRALTKDVWPGFWDVASGGVVDAGETYQDAACRELAEELGIVGVPLEPLGISEFSDAAVRVISHCYLARYSGEVVFADGEVVEAHWVTSEEFQTMQSTVTWCPDSVEAMVNLLGSVVPSWARMHP